MLNSLEIILKVTERCNLNCSYCYFFNRGDESYKNNPAVISASTIEQLVKFIRQAHAEYNIKKVRIDLHGGEPLLKKKKDFSAMCKTIETSLKDIVELDFSVQTNGILIDQDWIDIFSEYKMSVGVSLDGDKVTNDLYRLDHKGKGSYDRVIKALELLKKAKHDNKIYTTGVLSVININSSGAKAYQHLVHELGVDYMDFLLPNYDHDDFNPDTLLQYGKFLSEVFDCWVKDNNPKIRVRILSSILKLLLGGKSEIMSLGLNDSRHVAITISSKGDILPDDILRPIFKQLDQTIYNISNDSLKDFLEKSAINKILASASTTLPLQCQNCEWLNICGGGHLINRYSKDNFFNNPSVYCKDLIFIYNHIKQFLIRNKYIKQAA